VTMWQSLLDLMEKLGVVLVAGFLILRSPFFRQVAERRFTIVNQFALILFFGLVSIYGTLSGVPVLGAIANIRDLAPMFAGLTGGPIVGVGAGLIGAIHRFTLDGLTGIACPLATLLAGLLSGLIYLANRRRFVGWGGAVIFAALMEGLHMALILLIARPTDQAMALVGQIALPMIVANCVGMALLSWLLADYRREQKMTEELGHLRIERAK
jgi:sigma-B regulation protein RsbU (phosphoserine phosphatase)